MFVKTQRFYDAIYSWKDYEREVKQLNEWITRYKRTSGNTMLDIACGTGIHISFLHKDFTVEGLDLDPDMLNLAQERNPGVSFHQGSMTNFDLNKQFDVVICLFSSIAYAKTVSGLQQAVATMERHLRPGGVLIIEPFFTPEEWKPGRANARFVDQPDIKIARMTDFSTCESPAICDFHYLISTDQGVKYEIEQHEFGLFSHGNYQEAFVKAGLNVIFDEEGLMGRGLYIAMHKCMPQPIN